MEQEAELKIKSCEASNRDDFTAIFKLWNEAFEDSEQYLKEFFSSFDTNGRLILGVYDNIPVSFMCLIPINLRVNGVFHKGSYIYAACVKKDMRGRGIFAKFSDMCCDYIKYTLGDEFALLIPSTADLFTMYKKLGFNLKMCGLLPLCHERPAPVDTELFAALEKSDFDGNYAKLYEYYLKSDENAKLILDFDLYISSLAEHVRRGNVKYLLDFDTKEPAGYVIFENVLKNGKENINIYDIYFYGSDIRDIIYKIKTNLRNGRIKEKALWRIFTDNGSLFDFRESGEYRIYADILFEG